MQDKRIALVTGANQGVGFQVAKELVASGATVSVHRNRDQPRPDSFQGFAGGGIAGVLHPGRVTGPEHRAKAKLQTLLRAADQHDVAGIAAHAAADREMLRQALAQLPTTAGIAVAEMDGIKGSQALTERAAQTALEQGVNTRPAKGEHLAAGSHVCHHNALGPGRAG